jgi:hypothetical protein
MQFHELCRAHQILPHATLTRGQLRGAPQGFERKTELVMSRTCNQVFDDFVAHCDSRMAKNDLAFATFETYRGILDSHWRPEIGDAIFEDVKYSRLTKIVDAKRIIKKKTHNNIVSVVRCAFEYGYRDHPEKHSARQSRSRFASMTATSAKAR